MHGRLPRPGTAAKAALLGVVLASGCAGDGTGLDESGREWVPRDLAGLGDGEVINPGSATFGYIYEEIFVPICLECHNKGPASPKGLDMGSAAKTYANMVDVPSLERPAFERVEPGNAKDSYVYMKIVKEDARRAPKRMPRNGALKRFLRPEEIGIIRRWIDKGAHPDNTK